MIPVDTSKRQSDPRGAIAKTRQRLSLAMTGFLVVFTLLVGRLVEVSVLREPSVARSAASVNETSYLRADIVDRKGEILATDLRGASLFADARVIWDPAEAGRLGGGILRIQEAETGRSSGAHGRQAWLEPDGPGRFRRSHGVDHLLIDIRQPMIPVLRGFLARRGVEQRGKR